MEEKIENKTIKELIESEKTENRLCLILVKQIIKNYVEAEKIVTSLINDGIYPEGIDSFPQHECIKRIKAYFDESDMKNEDISNNYYVESTMLFEILFEVERMVETLGNYVHNLKNLDDEVIVCFNNLSSNHTQLWFFIQCYNESDKGRFNWFEFTNLDYWYRKKIQKFKSIDEGFFKLMHPKIRDVSIRLFKYEFFRHASLDSFIEVLTKLKEISVPKDEKLDGGKLVEASIFNTNNMGKNEKVENNIKFNNLKNLAEKNEQDAIFHLFMGLALLRNTDAHWVTFNRTHGVALGYIGLASLLMSLLDDIDVNKEKKAKEIPKKIEDLISKFDTEIKKIIKDIDIEKKKHYIAYSIGRNIFCLRPYKNKVLFYTSFFPIEYISEKLTHVRDVSEIGHLGTGNIEITISNEKALYNFLVEIKKQYEKINKQIL